MLHQDEDFDGGTTDGNSPDEGYNCMFDDFNGAH